MTSDYETVRFPTCKCQVFKLKLELSVNCKLTNYEISLCNNSNDARLPGFEDDDTVLGISSSIRKALKRGLHVADTRRVKRKQRGGTRKSKIRGEKVNKGEANEGKEDGSKEVCRECACQATTDDLVCVCWFVR